MKSNNTALIATYNNRALAESNLRDNMHEVIYKVSEVIYYRHLLEGTDISFPLSDVDAFALEAIAYNQALSKKLKKAVFPFPDVNISLVAEDMWVVRLKVYHSLKTKPYEYHPRALSEMELEGVFNTGRTELVFSKKDTRSNLVRISRNEWYWGT